MQHIFTMFGATILVPLLVNEQARAPVFAQKLDSVLGGV